MQLTFTDIISTGEFGSDCESQTIDILGLRRKIPVQSFKTPSTIAEIDFVTWCLYTDGRDGDVMEVFRLTNAFVWCQFFPKGPEGCRRDTSCLSFVGSSMLFVPQSSSRSGLVSAPHRDELKWNMPWQPINAGIWRMLDFFSVRRWARAVSIFLSGNQCH